MKFYKVDSKYIEYLKKFDTKVPNIEYEDKKIKFFCGVLIMENDRKYIVPVSSFKEKQYTNIQITNNKNEVISTLRFSFMIPVQDGVIEKLDFSNENEGYKNLVKNELIFCNNNYKKIDTKAKWIRYKVIEGKDALLKKNCCDFKLLEEKATEYGKDKIIEKSSNTIKVKASNCVNYKPKSKINDKGNEL